MNDHPDTVEVLGRTLSLPVEVRDASVGTATFLADWRAASALLPPGLEPLRVGPNRTLVTLVMVDYRDNDLGNYDEAAIQLTVTRPGRLHQTRARLEAVRGCPATWTVAMPVNQEFTLAAGCQIWGFPKTLDDIRVEIGPDRARCVWRADGRHVLTFSVPTGRQRSMPAPPLTAWTRIGGRLHTTKFAMSAAHGRLGVGGVKLLLGDHPLASVLGGMGLPGRAMLTTWMDDAVASFGRPNPA